MGRREPMYLAGNTYHVVQRGTGRQKCFTEPLDFVLYQDYLMDALLRYGVQLHAYALMSNHVHLLLTPNSAEAVSGVMRLLGNRYVQFVNKHYGCTGSLYEVRHRACLINSDHCLLNCYRYIDMNPVTASIVRDPGTWYWSSYAHNALGACDELVTPHPVYMNLGHCSRHRCAVYRSLCETQQDRARHQQSISI